MNKTWWKRIHNWMGIASAVFLLILLTTGILLNHPAWLKDKEENEIVVAHPVKSEQLLSGTSDGLYFSNDSGKNWEEVSMLYPPQKVVDIAFSPKNPEQIYVLEKWGKIFYSENDGKIWEAITPPFDPQKEGIELKKLSVGPKGKLVIFTSHGWTITQDKGKNWDITNLQRDAQPLHHLILTLHNGYFFGSTFVWLYDFAAGALLILIMSGFILWWAGRSA